MPLNMSIIAVLAAMLIAYGSVPLAIRIAPRINAIDELTRGKFTRWPCPGLVASPYYLAFIFVMLIFIPKSAQVNGLIIGAAIVFVPVCWMIFLTCPPG